MANPRYRKRLRQETAAPWQPLIRATVTGPYRQVVDEEGYEVFQNHRYTVLRRRRAEMTYLSIRRNDRQPIFDWRDIQRIKNELVGPECEGIQLFPAESRLVDSSNQYHLFVMNDPEYRFPIGFRERLVTEEPAVDSAVQRPFASGERPDDAMTAEQVAERYGDRVRDQVRDQVWTQVWTQVEAQIKEYK